MKTNRLLCTMLIVMGFSTYAVADEQAGEGDAPVPPMPAYSDPGMMMPPGGGRGMMNPEMMQHRQEMMEQRQDMMRHRQEMMQQRRAMMEQKQAMRQEHMARVEAHLANIESLLRELVELKKKQ